MWWLDVEVGPDVVGACKCVAAYLSNRISVGNRSNVRSKLHKAKAVRLAAIMLLARHDDNVLVPRALGGCFVFGAPARLPGDLILSHGMLKADPAPSAIGRKPDALSSPSILEELWYLPGLRWTNLHKMCRRFVSEPLPNIVAFSNLMQ